MKTKKLLSILSALLILCGIVTLPAAAAASPEATGYSTATAYDFVTYSGNDLGATYTSASTTFKVWAPSATGVRLKLYKTGSDEEPGAGVIGIYEMTKNKSNGVWSTTRTGDLNGVFYTYLVTVSKSTSETQDVYSKTTGVNGNRSMVVDMSKTNPDGWESDKNVLRKESTDSVVWELHVRDFSIDPSSGVKDAYKGKYTAFTQGGTTLNNGGDISTCVDYLTKNGINTVHLMPVFDFGSVDETNSDQRNWGYDPVNYNVPEGSYSTNPYDGVTRIKEFKQMIQALHDRGISVIMDVVYNHTHSIDSCFEKTVPGYYYRKQGTKFLDASQCGNVTASDRPMYRKYMIDSVKYWVTQYHIDGFRFDLMGCHDITTMNTIRAELNSLLPNGEGSKIMMYGEPWVSKWDENGISSSDAAIMDNARKLSPGIGMFNDKIRDALKGDTNGTTQGYIQGDNSAFSDVKAGLMANSNTYLANNWSDSPSRAVTYCSAHDNLCIWDKIVKSNGGTDYKSANESYLSQLKMAMALVHTSQGIVFSMAGDEMGRTKGGNSDSYKSNDEVNKIDWNRLADKDFGGAADYVKGLRLIRAAYSPFTDPTNTSVNASYFSTKTPTGVIAYTIQNKTSNASNEWGMVAVLANNLKTTQTVALEAAVPLPDSWATVVNGESAGLVNLKTVTGTSIQIPPGTVMMLVDKATFDARSINAPSTTNITVKHVDADTSQVIRTDIATYLTGSTYRITPDPEMLFDYTLTKTEGKLSGTVTSPVTVTFTYKKTEIPSSFINVQYVNASGVELSKPLRDKYRKGDAYSYAAPVIQGYQLDTDKIPSDMSGVFSGTEEKTIKFTYKPLTGSQTVIHYFKPSGWAGAYCYAYLDDGTLLTGKWAGKEMEPDAETGTGWYKLTVAAPSCRVIFSSSSSGADQIPGANQPGYAVGEEAWISGDSITYNTAVVTSYVNAETGIRLRADTIKTYREVSGSETYTTSPASISGYGLLETPINAIGKFSPGTVNVVYLYKSGGSTTLPPDPDGFVCGDANLDGEVQLKDATLIQKYLAVLTTLSQHAMYASDANRDETVSLKDATVIQKYLAGIKTGFPVGEYIALGISTTVPTTTEVTTNPPAQNVTLYFTNTKGWTNVYAYAWNKGDTARNAAWPGVKMTLSETNGYGQTVYKIALDTANFDYIIFSNGDTAAISQSVDIPIACATDKTAFYCTDDVNEFNNFEIGSYLHS